MKFKIHRCNCRKVWSIQNRKKKMIANSILLTGKWSTELKPSRSCNPKGFVVTNTSDHIIVNPTDMFFKQFVKSAKLIFDKRNTDFNFKEGNFLYFDKDGSCYLLKKREEV